MKPTLAISSTLQSNGKQVLMIIRRGYRYPGRGLARLSILGEPSPSMIAANHAASTSEKILTSRVSRRFTNVAISPPHDDYSAVATSASGCAGRSSAAAAAATADGAATACSTDGSVLTGSTRAASAAHVLRACRPLAVLPRISTAGSTAQQAWNPCRGR